MSEFIRMSREISATHATRLAESTTANAQAEAQVSSPPTSESDMMVDESGNVYGAAEADTVADIIGAEDGEDGGSADEDPSAAGSFNDEPDESMQDEDEEHEEELPILESNFEFEVGASVIVRRGGDWSGTITSLGSNPENFITLGKYQVSYEARIRKGRGFTRTMVHAWVDASALKRRVVSPRKSPKTASADSTSSNAPSKSADRPHMRQPDMEPETTDDHPEMAAHERGRKIKHKAKPTAALLGERTTKESTVPIAQRVREFPNQSFMEDS
eukprot:2430389-Prymnesium_polylepis.1